VRLPKIETIVKLVKTRAEDTTEGTMKFTNVRRQLLSMTAPDSGEYLCEAVVSRLSGRRRGIECSYKKTPDRDVIAQNMKTVSAAWVYDVLRHLI